MRSTHHLSRSVAVAAVAAMAVAGCSVGSNNSSTGNTGKTGNGKSGNGKHVTIAFSAPAADHGWLAALTRDAKAQAKNYKDITFLASEGAADNAAQVAQVETL